MHFPKWVTNCFLQQAHKVLKDIKNGQSFQEAAKLNGQSPFREKSGDWGVAVSVKEIRSEEIRKIASSLKKGELSKPFIVNILERSDNTGEIRKIAVYILTALEEHSGRKPLDEVGSQIERR